MFRCGIHLQRPANLLLAADLHLHETVGFLIASDRPYASVMSSGPHLD